MEFTGTMSDAAWTFLGLAVTQLVVLITGVMAGFFKLRDQRLELRRVAESSQKAADQTVTTGNGFARRVEEKLTAIEESTKANRDNVAAMRREAADDRRAFMEHLAHHPRSDQPG